MSGMQGAQDPYRELGVPRGATDEQVKAAHRRLAKRYHPDGADGDQTRFLAVQEAYLLLSDPIRRRDWDSRHAPGPVRANERPVPRRPTPSTAPPVRQPTTPGGSGAPGRARPTADPEPATAFGPASGRDPGVRRTTWSAQGVPWWEDFRAEGVTRGGGPPTGGATRPPSGTGSAGNGAPGGAAPGAAPPPSQGPGAGDIYSRSSGAAWSSAARRHFRRDEADLPRGGQFRYRGTQVVTGAEARQDAAAQVRRDAAAEARRSSAQAPPAPRPAAPAQSATRSTPTPAPAQSATRSTPTQTPDPSVGLRSRLRKLLGGG